MTTTEIQKKIKTSTMTVVCYSNVCVNWESVFQNTSANDVEYQLKEKKRTVDKKTIRGNRFDIVSIQLKDEIKGILVKKQKTEWCSLNCQLFKRSDEGIKIPIKSCKEIAVDTETPGIKRIVYHCNVCNQQFTVSQLGITPSFRNQISMNIIYNKSSQVANIMIFKNSYKMVGCKKLSDAYKTISYIWETLIKPHTTIWNIREEANLSRFPEFVYTVSMINKDFTIPFSLDRRKLDEFIRRPMYRDRVVNSSYADTRRKNVKMTFYPPPDIHHRHLQVLYLPDKKQKKFIRKNDYIIKKNLSTDVTIVFFSSSKITISGKNVDMMMVIYRWFVGEILENRRHVEEILNIPKEPFVFPLL